MNVRGNKTPTGQEKFNFFFEKLVPCVAGKKLWTPRAMVKSTITESGKVTITDEAFTELCILNYYDKWIHNGDLKWTDSRGGNCNYKGWKNEGYVKFDNICRRIAEQRRDLHDSAESIFCAHARTKFSQCGRGFNERGIQGGDETMELFNEL